MSSQMPTLGGPQRRRSSSPLPWILLLAVALAGVYGYRRYRRSHAKAPVAVIAPSPDAATAVAAEPPKPPAPTLAQSGLRLAHVTIGGPLESSVNEAAGPQTGTALTQVVTRILVWWLTIPSDFRKGDTLDILFEERPNQEPSVLATRYVSTKLGKTFTAYRFKAAGDTFPRYYEGSGEELELRLKDAPLDDYEQVTSHLRDGRNHKGVDFKTPLGTKVHATFAGTITRKTWNFRGNGNSLEVSDAKGRKALYLHLSALTKSTQVGQHVAKGEVIAESGNTGHTFAPHLHYQLMDGERVIDPFKVQETYRRTLPADQKSAFEAEVHKLDAALASGAPGATAAASPAPAAPAHP